MEVILRSRPDLHLFGTGAKNKVRVSQVVSAFERVGADISQQFPVDEDEGVYDLNVTDELEVDGEVFNGMDDEDLLSLLAIPMPIELKSYSVKKVKKLITEVLGISLTDDDELYPGTDEAVLEIDHFYFPSERMCVHSPSKIQLLFCGCELCAMSVSDFGNFLYALKNLGNEVALATLHQIYSGVNEE